MAKVKYGNWDLVAELDDYRDEMEKRVKKGVLKTTLAIYNTAVTLAPVDLGYLKESIDYKLTDGGFSGLVSVGADYAIYVEYVTGIYATGPGGSRAHKIPWSYKDADGKWHTTHGMPAQPFWNPAVDAGREVFERYFR